MSDCNKVLYYETRGLIVLFLISFHYLTVEDFSAKFYTLVLSMRIHKLLQYKFLLQFISLIRILMIASKSKMASLCNAPARSDS